ncbi:MAG: hypothetical protein AABX04_06095 [Nanoarchaeota archaeon]
MVKENNEHKKITLGLIFGWIFGVIFLLCGFSLLIQKSYISGIIVIFGSILIIPYFNRLISEKLKIELSSGVKWGIILIILIAFFVGISGNDSSPTVADNNINSSTNLEKSAVAKTSALSKVYLADTYNDLYLIFGSGSKYTDLQKEKIFSEKYKGNYVKWEGEVVDVDSTFGSLKVYVKQRTHDPFEIYSNDIILYLNSNQQSRLEKVSKKDMITYTGRLSNFENALFSLSDGEIVS